MILECIEKLKKPNILVKGLNLLFGTNELDFDLQDLSAIIEYKIFIDAKEWGIEDISINIHNIDLFARINIFKEDLNNDEIQFLKSKGFKDYSKNLSLFDWRLSINNNIKVENSVFKTKQIMICDLSIDINKDKDKILIKAVVL